MVQMDNFRAMIEVRRSDRRRNERIRDLVGVCKGKNKVSNKRE